MANQPLINAGTAILNELIAAYHRYNRVATGRTARETELVVLSDNHIQIIGPKHLINLEKGRRPTGGAGPVDRQRYGGMSFKESLKLWMDARGIEQKYFWPIYTKINREGYAGSPGVLSKPLSNDVINKSLDDNLGQIADLYATNVFKELFQ